MDEAFNEIIRHIFKVTEIRDTMTAREIPEWDSMNYLHLISELESRFSLSCTMAEVTNSTTIGDLRAIVHARGTV